MKYGEEGSAEGVHLRDVLLKAKLGLIEIVEKQDEAKVASQIEQVFVPQQLVRGTPEDFSFMAYPVPRLTLQERGQREFRDAESIKARLMGGHIRIDLDNFGRINWFYVTGLPALHVHMQQAMTS